MKKTLHFFLILLVVAGVSFGISLLVSNKKDKSPDEGLGTLEKFEGEEEEYKILSEGAIKLSSDEVSFPFLVPNTNDILYYHSRTGDLKSISTNKSSPPKTLASVKPFAIFVSWSSDGSQAIVRYPTSEIRVDIAGNTRTNLAKEISKAIFSKSSNDVAYLYFDDSAGEGNISVADSKFNNFKNILKTRLKSWEIMWNNERRLSLIATVPPSNLQSLYTLDTDSGAFVNILSDQRNLEINWSPSGQRLLSSRETRSGSELSIINIQSQNEASIPLKTHASKCAWVLEEKIYCGVPNKPLAVNEVGYTDDALVEIDLTKSSDVTKMILDHNQLGLIDIKYASYVPSLDQLVFTNDRDGKLYVLSLSQK